MEKKVFAKGLSYPKLFWIFIIGCFFGTYWEQIVTYIYKGIWQTQQGMVYGPFNPIYGFAASLLIYILLRKKRTVFQNFLLCGLSCGLIEILFGVLELLVTKNRSWDYSNKFLNIFGFTTIPYMCIWGLLGLFLIYVIYPQISKLLEKIPYNIGNVLTIIATILISLDFLLTAVVMIRHGLRQRNIKPYTFIGEIVDEKYDEEFMRKTFPDQFKDEDKEKD